MKKLDINWMGMHIHIEREPSDGLGVVAALVLGAMVLAVWFVTRG